MAHTKTDVMLGRLSGVNMWNDPVIWYNPSQPWVSPGVPISNPNMNIQLDEDSTDNLGTAAHALQTGDIIGVPEGSLGTMPTLAVSGFLHANSIQNLSAVTVSGSHNATVAQNVANVSLIYVTTQSSLSIQGSMINDPNVFIADGGTVELAGSATAGTEFEFGIGPSKLILDRPGGREFTSLLSFDPNATLELGQSVFDKATFIPNAPGLVSGVLALSEHGRTVYALSNVEGIAKPGFGFVAGVDAATGFDTVTYKSV